MHDLVAFVVYMGLAGIVFTAIVVAEAVINFIYGGE